MIFAVKKKNEGCFNGASKQRFKISQGSKAKLCYLRQLQFEDQYEKDRAFSKSVQETSEVCRET